MLLPLAMLAGLLVGFALAVYPGSAFKRLLSRPGSGWLIPALHATWPLLVLDLGGLGLVRVLLLLWNPAAELPTGLVVVPFLLFTLWRGWLMVETPVASLFLGGEVPGAAPSSRTLLLRPLRRPWWLLLRLAVGLPAGLALASLGWGAFLAYMTGHATGYAGAHAILAWRVGHHRADDPYLVRPNAGRIAFSVAGLTFFSCAFAVVIVTAREAWVVA